MKDRNDIVIDIGRSDVSHLDVGLQVQMLTNCESYFRVVDEKVNFSIRFDNHPREKDGIVLDVGSTQIQEPFKVFQINSNVD